MNKTIENIAKDLDFNSVPEYFDYFASVYINGQFSSLKKMLSDIRSADSVDALVAHLEETEQGEIVTWIAKN